MQFCWRKKNVKGMRVNRLDYEMCEFTGDKANYTVFFPDLRFGESQFVMCFGWRIATPDWSVKLRIRTKPYRHYSSEGTEVRHSSALACADIRFTPPKGYQ